MHNHIICNYEFDTDKLEESERGSVLPVARLASCHQNVNFKWYFVCYTDP